jgi:hypothetical protein
MKKREYYGSRQLVPENLESAKEGLLAQLEMLKAQKEASEEQAIEATRKSEKPLEKRASEVS